MSSSIVGARHVVTAVAAVVCVSIGGGCGSSLAVSERADSMPEVHFKDEVESAPVQPEAEQSFLSLKFSGLDGTEWTVGDLVGEKNLVVVFSRGRVPSMGGAFCPMCTTQVARLVRNEPAFAERDAKIVVVYPGEVGDADEFTSFIAGHPESEVDADGVTGRITLAVDENLAAVDRLMIREDLAKPSTYILDKRGRLRFAYVGRSPLDRPSIKAMLAELDRINESAAETGSASEGRDESL